MAIKDKRGLIKLLLVILVAVAVLGYFRVDLRSIVESESVQNNFDYLWTLLTALWDRLAGMFRSFINNLASNLT